MKKLLLNPLKTQAIKSSESISKIILIRHAESLFNLEISKLNESKINLNINDLEYRKLYNKIKFSHDLVDPDITETGKNQCYEAAKQLKDTEFKYIIVSPIKRSLSTCENILKSMQKYSRGRFNNPEVIVYPYLFEKIEDSCDILNDINYNMKQYAQYNWNLFNSIPHLPIYQIEHCDVYPSKQLVNEKHYYNSVLENFISDNKYNKIKFILEAMEQLGDDHIESSKSTIKRLKMFKTFLNKFSDDNKLEQSNKQKILVIGHSILFKHLTSVHLHEQTFEPAENEYVLRNCESVGLSFH